MDFIRRGWMVAACLTSCVIQCSKSTATSQNGGLRHVPRGDTPTEVQAVPQELLLKALDDAGLVEGLDYELAASTREGQQRVTLVSPKAREIASALGDIVGPRTRFARNMDL